VPRLFVLFNLRESQDADEYEKWAAARDAPTVRALPSVDAFDVYRIDGALQGSPPYAYVEVVDVNDMEAFGVDVATETMQAVAAEFAERAEPVFIFGQKII